jgi:membrane protease YdiL (CAAX protease family)
VGVTDLTWTEDMKGLLRALLFGAGLSLALIAFVPIVFWLSPEIAPPTDRTWAVGASSAFALFASAMAIWKATRLPPTPSWLIAIVGWIVGFNLAIFAIEIVFIALLSGR